MSGAAITGAFIMTSVGAFYLLSGKWTAHARIFVKTGVIGLRVQRAADFSNRRPARQDGHRPATRDSGRDGRIVSGPDRAPLLILGQPNEEQGKIDNPLQFRAC
jgi:cytochrome bd ubiquinol oxidase subunit I